MSHRSRVVIDPMSIIQTSLDINHLYISSQHHNHHHGVLKNLPPSTHAPTPTTPPHHRLPLPHNHHPLPRKTRPNTTATTSPTASTRCLSIQQPGLHPPQIRPAQHNRTLHSIRQHRRSLRRMRPSSRLHRPSSFDEPTPIATSKCRRRPSGCWEGMVAGTQNLWRVRTRSDIQFLGAGLYATYVYFDGQIKGFSERSRGTLASEFVGSFLLCGGG